MKRRKPSSRKTPKPRPVQRTRWLVLIVAVGVLTYANALNGPLIFDDVATVVQNPAIRELGKALSPPEHTPVAGRPLVNLSFALNHAAGGLDVRGYHLVNIALHLGCALLIFSLLRLTITSFGGGAFLQEDAALIAFAAALIWTVHPLNSEVVNYVTQRTESMMGLAYLATVYASARAHLSSQRARWYAGAVLSCAAGMACKETMVTAPVMVALYDRVFVFGSFREGFQRRARFYPALAVSWLLLLWLVASGGQTVSAGFSTTSTSVWTYMLNQAVMVTRYLWLTIWPHSLVVYYGWHRSVTLLDVWPYCAFVLTLLGLTGWMLVRRPKLGFPAAWFFITLAPTSTILPIATEVGAERRMYLPLVGVVSLFVIGVHLLWHRYATAPDRPKGWLLERLPILLVVLAAVPLAARTILRNREFESALTLAQTVLERWPTANAEYLVGTELAAAGRKEAAIPHLRAAAATYAPARFSLGSELLALGRYQEAIQELERFVAAESGLLATRAAHLLMARAYDALQQPSRAIEHYRQILRRDPNDVEVHGQIADTLRTSSAFDEAIRHYRAYLGARPRDANAWTGLGIALASADRPEEAVAAFRRAVESEPRNAQFSMNLARALVETGNLDDARSAASQAAAVNPNDPAAYDLLARILAAQGRLDEAREKFREALARDPGYRPSIEGLRAISQGR